MLEAGLALITACLPTLSNLAREVSFRRAADSIRSAFPLLSHGSSETSQSGQGLSNPYVDLSDRHSDASDVELAKPAEPTARTEYAMQDLGPNQPQRATAAARV